MAKQFKLGNYTYHGNDEGKFWMEGIGESPQFLYKHFSMGGHAVDSLINGQLWGSHPFQFNDPFDFHENLINIDSHSIVATFFREYRNQGAEEVKREFPNYEAARQYVQRHFAQIVYRKLGVISMSSNPNNLMMWSYYGNNQGFQVAYDWKQFDFKYYGPFPVNYRRKVKPISVSEYGIPLSILYQSNVKFIRWGHECEWRLLIDKGGDMKSYGISALEKLDGMDRLVSYPKTAVLNISLGNRFFKDRELEKRGQDLNITLDPVAFKSKDHDSSRVRLLNYLADSQMQVNICLYHNLNEFEIAFTKGTLSKIENFKFLYKQIPN